MFRSFRDYLEEVQMGQVDFEAVGSEEKIEEVLKEPEGTENAEASDVGSEKPLDKLLHLEAFLGSDTKEAEGSETEDEEEDLEEEDLEEDLEEGGEEVGALLFTDEEGEIGSEEAIAEATEVIESFEKIEEDDLERIWNQIIADILGEEAVRSREGTDTSGSKKSDQSDESDESESDIKKELKSLKDVVESLADWQQAVQQYVLMSTEAENIKEVMRTLASLGIILPDEDVKKVAEQAKQLGVPPSVLLKARVYDLMADQLGHSGEVPFPFMRGSVEPEVSKSVNPFGSVPVFRRESDEPKRTGFIGLANFLEQFLSQQSE